MRVVIYLEDNDGKQHNSTAITLNDQATIEALQKELADIFHIEPKFQHILFGEMRIHEFFGPLPQIGTGKEYKLVVKHSGLNNWVAFKELLLDIEGLASYNVEESIQLAVEHSKALGTSKFFVAYPRFNKTWINFNRNHAHKLDKVSKHIKTAAKEPIQGGPSTSKSSANSGQNMYVERESDEIDSEGSNCTPPPQGLSSSPKSPLTKKTRLG